MPTTTLKLPDQLKARVAEVVKGTSKSAHAFMVEAIERETDLAERRQSFVADALSAEEEALRTGLGYPADDVHAYLQARVRRKKTARPKVRRWRR